GARAADIADRRSLFHALAAAETLRETGHVRVERGDAAAMLENHDAAIAAFRPHELDFAVAGGFDDGTGCGRVIDAFVRSDRVQDRVAPARIEIGADASEIERRTQKLAPHAASVRGEVVGHRLVRGLEVDRSVGLAVVREVGGKDTPIADVLAVPKLLLVDDRESIAGANIEREVDVPTEDV